MILSKNILVWFFKYCRITKFIHLKYLFDGSTLNSQLTYFFCEYHPHLIALSRQVNSCPYPPTQRRRYIFNIVQLRISSFLFSFIPERPRKKRISKVDALFWAFRFLPLLQKIVISHQQSRKFSMIQKFLVPFLSSTSKPM